MNPLHRAARRNHAARLDAIEEQQEALRGILGAVLEAALKQLPASPAPPERPRLTVVGRE